MSRLLTADQVAAKLGYENKRSVYRLRDTDPGFPKTVVLTSHAHRWDEADVDAYIARKKEEAA